MLHDAVPHNGRGLEIGAGAGSGRFSDPLGIGYGVDPLRGLLKIAKSRGTEVALGEGEHLPYVLPVFCGCADDGRICFIDDVVTLFRKSGRVLVPTGILIIGFIGRGGEIEEIYRNEWTKGRFLRHTRFRTTADVTQLLRDAGFMDVSVKRRSHGFCIVIGQQSYQDLNPMPRGGADRRLNVQQGPAAGDVKGMRISTPRSSLPGILINLHRQQGKCHGTFHRDKQPAGRRYPV